MTLKHIFPHINKASNHIFPHLNTVSDYIFPHLTHSLAEGFTLPGDHFGVFEIDFAIIKLLVSGKNIAIGESRRDDIL